MKRGYADLGKCSFGENTAAQKDVSGVYALRQNVCQIVTDSHEKTGFAASTIAHNDEFATDFSHTEALLTAVSVSVKEKQDARWA